MHTSNQTLAAQVSQPEVKTPAAADAGYVAAAKNGFVTFFQGKGFACAADALQQLKATYKKMTVRFSVSDPKIASDQGHAVCYLSFAPLNKQYKIAVNPVQHAPAAGQAYTYTLLDDTFAKTAASRQKTATFYSLEELLDVVFPKATSFAGATSLQSMFSFLF